VLKCSCRAGLTCTCVRGTSWKCISDDVGDIAGQLLRDRVRSLRRITKDPMPSCVLTEFWIGGTVIGFALQRQNQLQVSGRRRLPGTSRRNCIQDRLVGQEPYQCHDPHRESWSVMVYFMLCHHHIGRREPQQCVQSVVTSACILNRFAHARTTSSCTRRQARYALGFVAVALSRCCDCELFACLPGLIAPITFCQMRKGESFCVLVPGLEVCDAGYPVHFEG